MLLAFVRVIKLALQQFRRNLWLSIATITLLALALLTINAIISLGVIARSAEAAVQNKIDVSVYFKPEVQNEQAESVRSTLLAQPEVKDVEYIPKEASLARFRSRHEGDPVIMESLEELGENPFGATLAIRAYRPDQYPSIIAMLEDPQYGDLIEEKNFDDHRIVIAKIDTLMRNIRSFGGGVAVLFGIISVLVVVNTVRVAIYTHRGEIRIMRLVGASNKFIRGPFLFEAILFAFFATLVTAGLSYAGFYFVQPYLNALFGDIDISLAGYYTAYAVPIFGLQFIGVLIIIMISSFFAVRRYLKV